VSWPAGTGEWSIRERGSRLTLTIDGEESQGRLSGNQVVLFPEARVFAGGDGLARLTGYLDDGSIDGLAELPSGVTFAWQAEYLGALADDEDAGSDETSDADGESGPAPEVPALVLRAYPAGAYGLAARPEQPNVLLVRNATIWTSAEAGVLEDADMLVRSGRIDAVGRGLEPPRGAIVIDATGKHVTAGLVDAHSHTAISRGINEVGSAITVEVRIEDVLDPTDINIYRQLAGGLTSANIMHGSANPMGGQVRTIKLRWGADADGLLFEDAPPGVKFALGENVKQSNWGDEFTTRYPQTRMGVDEIIRDTFDAASAYGEARANRGRNDPPLRRNLRLDAALEILNGERRVHVHSYRQDEILAFVRLAQDYALDVAAFQHVLEGYKVGPEIASIGAGASTFSDWWGFKYEVIDAIPYNGALMREAGVVVSFNSDDDELATRLNTEAAKAVKYGGVTEADALGFVTINPATQLGIADRVGSLEPGKDADFVIWSGDPLSTSTRAEQTWIEGRRYFDIVFDAEMRAAAERERSRLIQKALREGMDEDGPRDTEGDAESESEDSGDPPGARRSTDIYSSAHRSSHAKGERYE
jgi:imidazolonepropionase-like amidohydrolase